MIPAVILPLYRTCFRLAMAAWAGCAGFAASSVTQLRCEYQAGPLGLDTLRPRLSWSIASDRRGAMQTDCRILVASSAEILARDEGDLWDSGRRHLRQSTQVEYAGRSLESGQVCFWKVRAWVAHPTQPDRAARSDEMTPWSEPARWSMGLLRPGDWHGSWIGATEQLRPRPVDSVMGYHAEEAAEAESVRWVQVDLGRSVTFDTVVLHPPKPAGYEAVAGFGFPRRFRIDASDDPEFREALPIVVQTQADVENPGDQPSVFSAASARGRYVRITATKLWSRQSGAKPYCFALAELEVMARGTNVARHAPVRAQDSIEAYGWGAAQLTDGAKRIPPAAADSADPGDAVVLLRREFIVAQPLRRATAYVAGLGYHELSLNGQKASDRVLDPGFTDYQHTVLYTTYDVTSLLSAGSNALGVELGGGWYHLATPDLFGFEKAPWTAPPKLLLELVLEYADGTRQSVVSDASWKWSTGPVVFNCVRGGETIDARQAKPGWNQPGYVDGGWSAVRGVPAPAGRLVSQQLPPIRVTQQITPVSITEPSPGIYVFDLGVNISGWPRLRTRGPAGQQVVMKCNERLLPNGRLNAANMASHTHGRFQTGEFILRGEGEETYEPRFTYHGFRYVEVTGLAEKPTPATLTGCWVHTDPERAGEFACSNPLLNQLHEVILRTYLNNLHSIPTDCPQREKMGWLQDGCVSMDQAVYNYEAATTYWKWWNDLRDGQEPNGHVPGIVPCTPWGRSGPHGEPNAWTDPWWGSAIVRTAWRLYEHYDDRRILAEAWPSMQRYVDYLGSTATNHILSWSLGDWLEVGSAGHARRTPVALASTAAYHLAAQTLADTAKVLGRSADARRYEKLSQQIASAFNQQFLRPEAGYYGEDSQTGQALALSLGLVPGSLRGQVEQQLVRNIAIRNLHVSTGIVGVRPLFQALMAMGRDDLSYNMATTEEFPGWGYMLRHGATTIWEDWPGQASLNHPALGCVDAWFYEGLAGIRPDPAAPGFRRIVLRPAVVGDLRWVKASHRTLHGMIVSDWRREESRLLWDVRVPGNTTATAFIPSRPGGLVLESGRPAARALGMRFLRHEGSTAIYRLGAGNYHFQSELPKISP